MQVLRVHEKQRWFAGGVIALCLLATVLAYLPALQAPFYLDDETQITKNSLLQPQTSWSEFLKSTRNRALPYLSLSLNRRFAGESPRRYRLANLVLHLLNGLLVIWLAQLCLTRLTGSPARVCGLPLLAGAFFLLHPLHSQPVIYIVQRLELMAAAGVLLSVCAYLFWRSGHGIAWYAVSLAAGVGAVFSKESAATLPLLLGLADVATTGGLRWRNLGRRLAPFVVIALLVPVTLLLTSSTATSFGGALDQLSRAGEISRTSYGLTQIRVLVTYLRLWILPINQHLDYQVALASGLFSWQVFPALLFHLALIGVALAGLRRRPVVALGVVWFYAALLVTSSVIPIRDLFFEHRVYLSGAGLSLASAVIINRIMGAIGGGGLRSAALALPLAVFLTLFLATAQRSRVWADPLRLWSESVARSPGNARALTNLGAAHEARGDQQQALAAYRQAASVQPGLVLAHNNAGALLGRLGKFDKAIAAHLAARIALDAALRELPGNDRRPHHEILDPERSASIAFNLGNAYRLLGECQAALREYRRITVGMPHAAAAHNNAGLCWRALSAHDHATREFASSLAVLPTHIKAWNNYGLSLASRGARRQAARAYQHALDREPRYAIARLNYSALFFERQMLNRSLREVMEAVREAPTWMPARLQYGSLLYTLKRYQRAHLVLSAVANEYPRLRQAVLFAGHAALALRDWQTATARYRAVLRLAPFQPRLRVKLAQAFLELEAPDRAQYELARAVAQGLPLNSEVRSLLVKRSILHSLSQSR